MLWRTAVSAARFRGLARTCTTQLLPQPPPATDTAHLLMTASRPLSCSPSLRQLLFTKDHEWIRVDGGVGTVGISDYAQESLGDVVYAQLPEAEETVAAGEDCGALESVKAASEIVSPVTGIVVEKNEAVEKAPALINSSPMDEGWLFKVKLEKEDEVGSLMDQDAYDKYLKAQEDKD